MIISIDKIVNKNLYFLLELSFIIMEEEQFTKGLRAVKKNYGIQSLPRMFEEVTRQIIYYINEEKLEPGSKLPTERQLSELLQVSRSSVREGIRVLEILRYLDSRQGEGTFVSTAPPYLLPLTIIKKEVGFSELRKYYQVGLLHAKQILLIGAVQQVSIETLSLDYNNFWSSFSELINHIGVTISNEFYLELYNTTDQLLVISGFYESLDLKIDIRSITEPYQANQIKIIERLLHEMEEAKIK
jgi:GntR family transcriptional repressor for pyruvate dehydrogenase complex